MKPLYFGASDKPLFGIYERPRTGGARPHGVLLCYPGVQEYNMSHWAFRNLGAMLARVGFHVFRFDYFGTGDSAGRGVEGRPEQWISDIHVAARELQDISGVRSLSIVGMRLGATLATRACAEGLRVRDLVLWDPVVSGDDYVDELERWDQQRNLLLLHAWRARRGRDELLGFSAPASLRRELRALGIGVEPRPAAERVHLVVAEEKPSYFRLRDALVAAGFEVGLTVATEAAGAQKAPVQEEAVMASQALRAISRALVGTDGAAG